MTGGAEILPLDRDHVWHPFTQEATAPLPMVAVAGEGAHVQTLDGRRILDLVSSWWVNLHGHAHPAIAEAIAGQAGRLEQVIFADFTHEPAARLAARLARLLPGGLSRIFYSDDGSTAVEAALKIALQYFSNLGQAGRTRFVGFEGGYHGDTVGAMSVGRDSGYFRAWDGMLFDVALAPFPATWIGDEAVEEKERAALAGLDAVLGDDVAAVIAEPLLQGAAGMRVCRPEFLREVARRTRAAGALLILDEVLTGFGRTGPLFACAGAGVEPDLVCLSKGLTGGFLPMGATVATETIHQAFLGQSRAQAFLHGHSYTANPLGCAAGLVSLDLLAGEDCVRRRAAIEAIHKERLGAFSGRKPRLAGTIAAIDLASPEQAAAAKAWFLKASMLVRPIGASLYFLPPYCIAPSDLNRAWDVLEAFAAKV